MPVIDAEAKIIICDWVIKNSNSYDREIYLARALARKAYTYYTNRNNIKASESYFKTLEISKRNNFFELEFSSLLTLANIYTESGQNQLSIDYITNAINIAKKNNYKIGIATGLTELATRFEISLGDKIFNSKDTITMVFSMKKEAIKVAKEINDTFHVINYLIGLGESYSDLGFFDSSILVFEECENFMKNFNDDELRMSYYFIYGKMLNSRGKATNNKSYFVKSNDFMRKSLELAQRMNNPTLTARSYSWLSSNYKSLGDYEKALSFFQLLKKIKDSTSEAQNFEKVNDIRVNFEKTKSENELLKMTNSNQQKSTLNKILIGSAIGLILFSLLGYRNFKNKQKVSAQQEELQKQKIAELEKDKQLLAIDAMLQGQEEERSRIAKDLHDGLGGMLSGTKLSFINMKENLVLTPENAVQFDKSLSMLDNTIADLRKVAHNLMPEALVKFGLQEAVRDFCNSIQSSTNVKVVYQPLGENRKLSNTAEVFTYRIIQELVNNAVKHANASQIIVQLTTNNNKVGIAVEDDGKGFDVNALTNSKGAGMDNIKYRVQYFNGTIDTVTSAGNGTSVNIELSV